MILKNCINPNKTPQATFYRSLRPFAVFCKILGMLPIQGTMQYDGRKISYRFWRLIIVWDFVLLGFMMTVHYHLSSFETLVHTNMGYTMEWQNVYMTVSIVRSLAQFIISHTSFKFYPKLIHMIEDYYSSQPDLCKLQMSSITKMFLIALVIVLAVFTGTTYAYYAALEKDQLELGLDVLSLLFMNMPKLVPLTMYGYFCYLLTIAFYHVKREIKINATCLHEDLLEKQRLNHAKLAKIIVQMERCYGRQLGCASLFLVIDTVLQLYMYLMLSKSTDIYMMNFTVYNFVTMAIVYNLTHHLVAVAHSVVDVLKSIPISKISPMCRMEIQMFLQQLIAAPVQVTASGYFVIGRAQLTAILGSVATYLIVMIQFEPYLWKLTGSNSTTCDSE